MAKIVGGIATSHIPSIGKAIARGLVEDPYWKDFFDGFKPVHDWLEEVQPDVAVVVYNDHGLNFFLDKMPTFAVGAAPEYRHSDEWWGPSCCASVSGVSGVVVASDRIARRERIRYHHVPGNVG